VISTKTLIFASTAVALALGSYACSSSDDSGPGSGSGGSGAQGGGAGDSGVVGQIDGGVTTTLPEVPAMSNVYAKENDDSVSIRFDPVDDARDYRVYPLPKDEDIQVDASGNVVVKNAIYRCAGDREAPEPMIDDGPDIQSNAIRTLVDNQEVGGYTRQLADATLGYVHSSPGEGLVPVHVLGDPSGDADQTDCYFARWTESRVKKYVTDEAEYQDLLAQGWRDDGVQFYVPSTASAGTKQIYLDDGDAQFYFPEGPEADVHDQKEPAFLVLKDQATGTVPLMRVYYDQACARGHDELVPGKTRFERAWKQGAYQPWLTLTWSPITEETTLVVEALDSGCPFQGHLSPKSIPNPVDDQIQHQPWITIDEARAASATGEVFINGQHEATNRPKAIARAFLKVKPKPHEAMDWFMGFSPGTELDPLSDVDCGVADGNCFQSFRQQSATLDVAMMSVATDIWALGQVQGELWVSFADWAADTGGKFRLTPKQKANMDASTFLHVTMEVNMVSTGRRYPQILISDQDAPVQYNMPNGNTLIVQTFSDWPNTYEVQVCDHRDWDVNNQCPEYETFRVESSSGDVQSLAPVPEVGELSGSDHRVAFDVYASTKRVYLFLEKQPYACVDLPAAGVPSGPVTVTYGDVLYHSGADDNLMGFHDQHMKIEMRRQWDNLGFSSGKPAPIWDETRLPCRAPISLSPE
jgi:hypothetical protein